jgi:hypothetical protein
MNSRSIRLPRITNLSTGRQQIDIFASPFEPFA